MKHFPNFGNAINLIFSSILQFFCYVTFNCHLGNPSKKSVKNFQMCDSADLLAGEVEEAVHDGVGDGGGHGKQMEHREHHKQLLVTVGTGLLCMNNKL